MDLIRLIVKITAPIFWVYIYPISYPFTQRNKKNTNTPQKKDAVAKLTLATTAIAIMMLPPLLCGNSLVLKTKNEKMNFLRL